MTVSRHITNESVDVHLRDILRQFITKNDLVAAQRLMSIWKATGRSKDPSEQDETTFLTELMGIATKNNNGDLAGFLRSEGAILCQETPYMFIHLGRAPLEYFKLILKVGWDVNDENWRWGSPLFAALRKNDVPLVYWLLQQNADPNKPLCSANQEYKAGELQKGMAMLTVPLDFAAAYCDVEVIDLLIHHGAKLEASNALHAVASASRGDKDQELLPVAKRLLDLGMDINALEFKNYTDPRKPLGSGRTFGTPLHYAAISLSNPIHKVRYLLKCGADVGRKDNRGRGTAVDWIKDLLTKGRKHSEDATEVFEILIRHDLSARMSTAC